MSVFLLFVLFCNIWVERKKPAKEKVARKGSVLAAEAGAIAKKAPKTSEGRAVVVHSEEEEEEEKEEEAVEMVAEGNKPAEIVKQALEAGELNADETVDCWFTEARQAGRRSCTRCSWCCCCSFNVRC